MTRAHTMLTWRMLAVVLACLFVAGMFPLVSNAAGETKISVVVSKASTYKPSEGDIKSYFTGIKLEWPDGKKIQILDQPDAPIAKVFYEKFIGSSIAMVRKEWTKLILSGQASAPVKCASNDEVKKALAANPAAIGFIDGSALDASVREVAKIE